MNLLKTLALFAIILAPVFLVQAIWWTWSLWGVAVCLVVSWLPDAVQKFRRAGRP